MANLHTIYLKPEEVREIAHPILKKRLKAYGFDAADVSEDEATDGESYILMVARVKRRVPGRTLIDTNNDIHTALRKKGEERFVFLSTERPNEDPVDEDEE